MIQDILLIITLFVLSYVIVRLFVERRRRKEIHASLNRLKKEMDSLKNELNNIVGSYQIQDEVVEHSGHAIKQETDMNSSPIVIRFKLLANKGVQPDNAEWLELRDEMIKSLPTFYNFLYSYINQLSFHDFQVCMLVRLNFRPGQIANLMGMSNQRICNIYRLCNNKIFNENTARTLPVNLFEIK